MATRIPGDQIQNLQQIEAIVAGPDGANRLLTVTGQFDVGINAIGIATNLAQSTTVFSVLVGPVLTRQQFHKSIGIAWLAKTQVNFVASQSIGNLSVNSMDADWDDESGQVELRVEVSIHTFGQNNITSVNGIAFQSSILYSAS